MIIKHQIWFIPSIWIGCDILANRNDIDKDNDILIYDTKSDKWFYHDFHYHPEWVTIQGAYYNHWTDELFMPKINISTQHYGKHLSFITMMSFLPLYGKNYIVVYR